MALSEIGRELMEKLKKISNNREFVCGAMSNAPDDVSWKKMLDFIERAEKHGDIVTTDDIISMSILLGQKD